MRHLTLILLPALLIPISLGACETKEHQSSEQIGGKTGIPICGYFSDQPCRSPTPEEKALEINQQKNWLKALYADEVELLSVKYGIDKNKMFQIIEKWDSQRMERLFSLREPGHKSPSVIDKLASEFQTSNKIIASILIDFNIMKEACECN